MAQEGPREAFAGPEDGPASPFPLQVGGPVIKGFGRGSKELGIPTANIPLSGLAIGGHEDLESGVYFGWAALDIQADNGSRGVVYPMVMSLGWNPFYKNTVRTIEVHIMNEFNQDFYGHHLNIIIVGFIRPEFDYVSKEFLIRDIKTDVEVAQRSLARPPYLKLKDHPFLMTFPETPN